MEMFGVSAGYLVLMVQVLQGILCLPCFPRDYGHGSFVCVCNSSYCDTLEPLSVGGKGKVTVYTSTKTGERFSRSTLAFQPSPSAGVISANINRTMSYQFILGFGGAFTDAAGINIASLPPAMQLTLMKSYYSENGSEYTMGRVPMASCDFSTHTYSYDDVPGDLNLTHFRLAEEDLLYKPPLNPPSCSTRFFSNVDHLLKLKNQVAQLNMHSFDDFCKELHVVNEKNLMKEKAVGKKAHCFYLQIPYIKMAKSMSKNNGLLLFGSPWSAPAWMKTNEKMTGRGFLKGQPGGKYYQAWAEYFVRFLQAYENENVTFWGLTTQNEPTDGLQLKFEFQSMGFTPATQRDFIKLNLGPTLAKSGYGVENIKLMIMDDIRILLPKWADVVLDDPAAAQYVSGLAYHWYLNQIAPARLLDIVQEKHPRIFILSTEACAGSSPWDIPKVILGSWERAESYAHDIIQDLLHWTIGWIDWNLALDLEGGPNWVRNFVDAPIVVNASGKEFYKQPMYYALAHFSKLLPPGSLHIGLNIKASTSQTLPPLFDMAAFQTPQDNIVFIAVNRQDEDIPIVIQDAPFGYLSATVPSHSIQSYVWHA